MAEHSGGDGAQNQASAGEAPSLLPPDGVPWPPEPPPVPTAPQAPDMLPPTARRPADSHIDDWRSMPAIGPDGYQGSAGQPPLPAPAVEPWSIAAFVCSAVGLLPWLWPLPVLPCLAIGFGLAGRRACTLNPTLRGKALANAAVGLAVATLLFVLAAGRLAFVG